MAPRQSADASPADRQPRARLTRERILAAAESLLAEGGQDALTMEEVAERAHVSVGAIYKRFRGKSTLLPQVLERAQRHQAQRLRDFLDAPQWRDAGLGARIDGLLAVFARTQVQQRRLIRALVVGHWQAEDRHANDAGAAAMMTAIHAWLAERRDEIRHPQPGLALSLGLFAALQCLQTAILMERLPPTLAVEDFTAEMARQFRRYLGLPEPAPE
ncbi:TetR/AcrR family transcriptional regulator [Arenimonas composti]|uniref:HTH tetR-type domain-containing protein n=1 Tax=Arenimonas composti TR7-09 = DSM 18010 TaxID=1121013 RepID=A0A091BXB8_9GAMM|nr:TetR/AcrR family transcriptional regulator [Arenimonas composti]KFN48975.1 hypothetical protein P873_12970 [Arenimonas composti TR7-09 = DSM 18010]